MLGERFLFWIKANHVIIQTEVVYQSSQCGPRFWSQFMELLHCILDHTAPFLDEGF